MSSVKRRFTDACTCYHHICQRLASPRAVVRRTSLAGPEDAKTRHLAGFTLGFRLIYAGTGCGGTQLALFNNDVSDEMPMTKLRPSRTFGGPLVHLQSGYSIWRPVLSPWGRRYIAWKSMAHWLVTTSKMCCVFCAVRPTIAYARSGVILA